MQNFLKRNVQNEKLRDISLDIKFVRNFMFFFFLVQFAKIISFWIYWKAERFASVFSLNKCLNVIEEINKGSYQCMILFLRKGKANSYSIQFWFTKGLIKAYVDMGRNKGKYTSEDERKSWYVSYQFRHAQISPWIFVSHVTSMLSFYFILFIWF